MIQSTGQASPSGFKPEPKNMRPKQVVILVRTSSNTGTMSAFATQIAHTQAYATSQHWEVLEVYRINAAGRSVMEHPEAKRFAEDVRQHRISGLIVSDRSRLGRDPIQLAKIVAFLKENKVILISLDELF